MTTRTYTFDRAARKDGQIFIGFQGTKHGLSFDSLQALREAVKLAYGRDREHQMMLALGAFLRTSTNPADLNGVSFTADDGNG